MALLALAACAGQEADADADADSGAADASTPPAARSAEAAWVGWTVDSGPLVVEVRPNVYEITYTDVTGLDRTVQFEVRAPQGGTAGNAVVVWSHGGSAGKTNASNAGVRWGKALTSADNVFVAVAHPGRSAESRADLCAAIGVPNCAEFKYLLWDRLTDVIHVFDWLERAAKSGELMVDMGRLAYGGHSAGAMAVMVMAGMASPYDTDVPMPTDPRPAAFLAASPPGAEENELTTDSFAALDRPTLLLTGPADTTNGTTGPDRLAAFDLIDTDQVMLTSTDSEQVGHTTFDLNTDPCRQAGGTRTHCTETVAALAKVAQVFLRSALSAEGLDAEGLVQQSATRLPAGMTLQSAG